MPGLDEEQGLALVTGVHDGLLPTKPPAAGARDQDVTILRFDRGQRLEASGARFGTGRPGGDIIGRIGRGGRIVESGRRAAPAEAVTTIEGT
jgi:hypothetical protein